MRDSKCKEAWVIRKTRMRKRLSVSAERPRLTVFRSNKHLYAQIVDDSQHQTLAAASTRSKELKGKITKTMDVGAAKEVGKLIGQKAKAKSITTVCFDRSGYAYHGRIKALADAARAEGLTF